MLGTVTVKQIIKNLSLPLAMFLARTLVSPSKQMEQLLKVTNPNCPGADQLAIYKRGRGIELRTTVNKSRKWSERNINPGWVDSECDSQIARPRCLCSRHKDNTLPWTNCPQCLPATSVWEHRVTTAYNSSKDKCMYI